MDVHALIAKAALLTAVVSRSESERIADAVLAALEAEGIVVARYDDSFAASMSRDVHDNPIRYLVPLESLPESEK
jgi:hypothetical protein